MTKSGKKSPQPNSEDDKKQNISSLGEKPSHVVAVGVSAGGLEALENFFNAVDDNLGCAYVVVQHLSPDFKSMMDQLLKKYTSMPIVQAQDGDTVERNKVYLVPAGTLLRIINGKIKLTELPKENRINLPINAIFTNFAHDAELAVIGIILSGTGSDGCRGIVALKEYGAMVIAQDPAEAQFNGMPQNAINTGAVDFVLKTEEMPEYIKNFVSHPLATAESETFKYHLSQNTDVLRKILILIQDLTGLDFKAYKESTVSRRIKHRMSINNKVSLNDYWEYLRDNESEIELVKQDLLIGVTRFFRDREVWETLLEDVIRPMIIERDPNDTIRVWCAGCSTGEEPYTIAMLFDMTIKELGVSRKVKVFASDIDQTSISYAGNGIYPNSISDEVPAPLLASYFNQLADGEYQVNKELRSLVVFATHNVIQDPPFSNMDIVSCRNCLIYLQQPAQQKAMAFFHFSLKKNGYMMLGSSESPGKFANYFPPIDSKKRLYQKVQDIRIPISTVSNQGLRRSGYELKSIPQFVERVNKKMQKPKGLSFGLANLQDRYIPPTFILNSKLQVIYTYGDTSNFTQKIRPGEVTNDISEIVKKELCSSVLSGAHECLRGQDSVILERVHKDSESGQMYALECHSFSEEDETDRLVSLSFVKEVNKAENSETKIYTPDEQTQQRIIELETAYVECQRMYREALEDLDSTSEELQSSNEELMAANEELQSTNEELQSVNEELYTVNSEYQQKILELTDTNNDLENLLNATDMAVLFLDANLNIRRYTRPIRKYINIMDFDLNRPFEDLSLKFKMDDLQSLIKKANLKGENFETTIQEDNGKSIAITISPYISGKENQGVVVSIIEIDKS
jgi:two-component system CheB/CheR fusion protein